MDLKEEVILHRNCGWKLEMEIADGNWGWSALGLLDAGILITCCAGNQAPKGKASAGRQEKVARKQVSHNLFGFHIWNSPTSIYLLNVNYINTRTRFEVYSNLTIKTSEQHQRCHSDVFIVNFGNVSHFFPVFILLNLNS